MTGEREPARRRPAEIEREIEATRERMSEDIEAIGEKFTPAHVKARAREALQDAREAAMEKVQEVAHQVKDTARDAGTGVAEAVRRNPVPAAMIGVGVAWLVASGRDESRRRRYDRRRLNRTAYRSGEGAENEPEAPGGAVDGVKERAQELAAEAGDKARQLKEDAAGTVRRAGEEARGFFEENPLVAGLAVAALGAALGSLLPRTRREERLLGKVGQDAIEKVKTGARDLTDKARQTTQEALHTFADAASDKGGTEQGQYKI
jgi:ElaB/YqjD/DUF883 family membrane-anchored ribosome-binding protein